MQQRPDTRICVVQRISDRMKECEGDGCQRKSEAVEKECRTSGGQTDMTDIVVYRFKGKEEQFVFNSLFNRKPVKSVKDGRYVI